MLIPMSTDGSGEILQRMVAMFDSGDLSALEATVHPDYVDHQGLDGEPMRGRAGFAEVVTTARAAYEDFAVTVEDLIEGADRAAARLRWRGRRDGGDLVEWETLEIIRLADGLAAEHWGGKR